MADADRAFSGGPNPLGGRPTADPLAPYRRLMGSPADRVRWACTLEAVAPKFGNVHPSASFVDLRLSDFVVAGEQLAAVVEEAESAPAAWPLGRMVLEAVQRCRQRTGTNVNLGIALLVVPLVRAERLAVQRSVPLPTAMHEVLDGLDAEDGRDVYAAIRVAQPGGLGKASELDVNEMDVSQADRESPPVDLLSAMRSAADRDAIARQYATGFAEFYDGLLPVIEAAIGDIGDVLFGIREAQLRLLARGPDTLIARKCGPQTAAQGQALAAEVLATSGAAARSAAEDRFDRWLRADGHRRNPGTTADLIAAGLYVLLSKPSATRVFQ